MDVTCANCGEPWDTYHLRHDEVHETDAGTQMIDDKIDQDNYEKDLKYSFVDPPKPNYKGEKWAGKLTPFWRKQFKELGWEFGGSLYAVMACPCCKDKPALENSSARKETIGMIADLLKGDDDGLAVTLEDMERDLCDL